VRLVSRRQQVEHEERQLERPSTLSRAFPISAALDDSADHVLLAMPSVN
jgi:hypothetical protein